MKTLLAFLLILGGGLTAAPHAEARPGCRPGHIFISHHLACGRPVYKERFVAYYDSCGRPVFRVRVLPVRHDFRAVRTWHHPRRFHHRGRAVIHRGHHRWNHGRVHVRPGVVRRCR